LEVSIRVPSGSERVSVLGAAERNLKMIREGLGVGVIAREGSVRISGSKQAVVAARRVIERLAEAASGEPMDRQQVLDLIAEESGDTKKAPRGWEVAPDGETNDVYQPQEWDGRLNVYSGGKALKPRTPNQERYLEAIRTNDLVFGIGPAGTGKTYLAVAAAVHLLKTGRVRRLLLARPAVEAGEKLGFLPGDLREKVNPYLRPLFDALNDMMDYSTVARFMQSDVVEVVPLAFMRGRTLNNAVIILDEAQNTTRGQMLMFLTRMGQGSKMIVTGDVTQIDLPDPTESGLIDAARKLNRTKGVGFVQFEKTDVVRHDLVQRVIEAYGEEGLADAPARSRPRRKSGTDNSETPPAE